METQRRTRGAPPPRGPGRPSPPGGIWPWLAAVLLIVVAGLLLGYFLTRGDDAKSSGTTTERVAVPGVIGFSVGQAVAQVRRAGLRSSIRRELAPESAGTVVNQRPAAGQEVATGSLLVLTVSQGPAPVQVPNLIGLNQAQAGVRLSALGLEARYVRETSDQPSAQVIAQRPAPGTAISKGSTVRVTLSKGGKPPPPTTSTATTTTTATTPTTTATGPPPPNPVKVPNVVGDTLEQALAKISAAKLLPGPMIVASNKPAGQVISQRPKGGSTADSGTVVRISVSAP
jgi:serine/threonine-protein kinase